MKRVIGAVVGIILSTAAHAQYRTPAVNSPLFPSTPSSGKVPIASGSTTADWGFLGIGNISGLGTGVATALGNGTNTAGGVLAPSAALTLNGVVYGGGSGVSPGSTAAGTNNQALMGSTGVAPSFRALLSADLPASGVTNAILAQMTADTVKCNPTGSTANAQDCASPVVSGTVTSSNTLGGSTSGFVSGGSTGGSYAWQVLGQSTDQKYWDADAFGLTLNFRAVNDANNAASNWMTVTRGSGFTIASVSIPTFLVPYTAGLFSNGSPAANITRIDRLLVSTATINSGDSPITTKDWLETLIPNTTSIAQMGSISPVSAIGVLGASRTSDGSGDALGNTGFVDNNVSTTGFGWSFYGEAWNDTSGGANAAFTTAMELDIVNKNATPVNIDPYSINPGGETATLWLASGGSRSGVHTASAAMVVLNNGANFNAGLIFSSNSIAGGGPAILLPSSYQIVWYTSTGVTGGSITSAAAPGGLSFQVGSALAAAVFFNGVAHIETTSGLAPTLTTCGSPGASIVGNDWGGAIVAGTGATACTMTFSHTYAAQPLCIFYQQGGTTAVQETSVGAGAITFVAAATGTYIYHCFARPGG